MMNATTDVIVMKIYMLMSGDYAPARNVNMTFNTWVIFTVKCKIYDCRGQGKFIRAIWYTRLLNIYLKSVGYYRSNT